jgi:peptidoglycan/LPS O-acetylase OafA/YrhL
VTFTDPFGYFIGMTIILGFVGLLSAKTKCLQGPAFAPQQHMWVALDGLRGVLATGVFFCHYVVGYYFDLNGSWDTCPSPFYQHLGFISVGLFFVLSGFLFWHKVRRHTLRPAEFLKGRARRILPAHVSTFALCLLLIACVSGFSFRDHPFQVLKDALSWLFFGFPFLKHLTDHDVNSLGLMKAAFGNIWTLHLEWLFYFSLPLLAWFSHGRRIFALFPCVVLLLLGAHQAGPALVGYPLLADLASEAEAYGYGMVIGFAPGMLATYLSSQRLRTFATSGILPSLTVILSLALLMIATPANGGPQYLILGLPFALIAAGNDVFGLLSSRPVQLLGRVSYSFYLVHCLVIVTVVKLAQHVKPLSQLTPITFWIMSGIVGSLVFGVSLLSYRYVEYPWFRSSRTG